MSQRFRAFCLRLTAPLDFRRQQREYAEELAFQQHILRERQEREGIVNPIIATTNAAARA